MWLAEEHFIVFAWFLVNTLLLQLLEMFFGNMTHDISRIVKHSAYNHLIFVRQEIKN